MAHANHPYHVPEPSKWPAFGATGALLLAFGMVLYMHPATLGDGLEGPLEALGVWKLAPGLLVVAYTMFGWWTQVVQEATHDDSHTPVVQLSLRYGMVLFIASEVMFFAAFFWAFFDASLFPKEATGFVWPPEGVHPFDPFDLPFLNTLILLTSGFTVTWAHHDIVEGKMKHATMMLGITVALGALFTCVQAYEYGHAAFGFREGIYPSTFYMATGFHGFHVLIGTTFLIVCWIRCARGHFKPDHHFGFEAAAWYWHFVDVVWLFLFICVYWWGAGDATFH